MIDLPTGWTDEDEALFKRLAAERLPFACACSGIEPGETLCPCAKVRAEIRQEISAEKPPSDRRK